MKANYATIIQIPEGAYAIKTAVITNLQKTVECGWSILVSAVEDAIPKGDSTQNLL